jgi:small subunit ribosomal protein S2
MLTNFSTIRKSIKKKQNIEKMLTDGSFNNITKKERLMLARQQAKLDRVLGGIENLGRVPAAVFMVDISHEHIALAEAKKLGIKTFGIVDTNSDPTLVDFAVPGNDDASKSIKIITEYLVEAIKEGLADRKRDKEVEEDESHEDAETQEDSAEEETKEEETKEESSETAE